MSHFSHWVGKGLIRIDRFLLEETTYRSYLESVRVLFRGRRSYWEGEAVIGRDRVGLIDRKRVLFGGRKPY